MKKVTPADPQDPVAHIVDDDDAIRDALGWLFETRGVQHRTWPSAEDFLAAWQAGWRGCVVLDIRMHGMTGLECFEALKARECTLPVIFITGHGDVPIAVSALKNGAFDFIEKPFDDNALVDVVLEALASDFGTSRWHKTRSRTRVAGVWSHASDPAADRFPGGRGVIQAGFSRELVWTC
jgi:FixJ family two-component response regulator